SSEEIVPRALPAATASDASTVSWQVNALVDATPISGPARIGKIASAARAMVDSLTLTTAPIFNPDSWQYRKEASVSAVWPDCEINNAAWSADSGISR